MLGAFAVGKSSLVNRLMQRGFGEKYHTTVGVRIVKKPLVIKGKDVNLIIWDLHGEDDFQHVRMTYLRGSSGYVLVVDGTRPKTLEIAKDLKRKTDETVTNVPFVMVVNKSDRKEEWEITEEDLNEFRDKGWTIIETSAKLDTGVKEAFSLLASQMLEI